MKARAYQNDAIQQLRDRVDAGRVAPLCVLPTGGGKSYIQSELARLHLAIDPANRVLCVAHRKELIGQMARTMLRNGITDIGEILPGVTPRPRARIQVASTQTLRARDIDISSFTLILFDEAHHYSSDDWHELTKTDALRIGFTATPMRSDGRGMSPAFDSIVVVSTIKELTRLHYLVPCRVISPLKSLRKPNMTHAPVDAYLEHAPGSRCVVFADFVENAEKFVAEFNAKGIRAVIVHGELKDHERKAAFAAHDQGAVLVNCMVLTEGWDSPATTTCILARGCGSVGTYLQIVGRVLRPCGACDGCKAEPRRVCDTKPEALVIDLTGRSFNDHGPPDADRTYHLVGKGIRKKEDGDKVFECPVCGQPVEPPPNSWPCGVCNYTGDSKIEAPRYTGDELAERYSGKRSEADEKRIDTLARWFAEAKSRAAEKDRKGEGWKWAAVAKYTAVYGGAPSPHIRMQAEALSITLACVACSECRKAVARTYRGGKCGSCAFRKQG